MTGLPQSGIQALTNDILAASDRCVACGLCLERCPTYQVRRLEAESPRGRIALMRGLAQGVLQPSPDLISHLDSCLGCRTCEQLCPALVPYAALAHEANSLIALTGKRGHRRIPWLIRRLQQLDLPRVLASAWLRRAVAVWPFRNGRLGYWKNLLGSTRAPARSRQSSPATFPRPAGTTTTGLFTGCLTDLDAPVAMAARHVLMALGHDVIPQVPGTCCGGLSVSDSSMRAREKEMASFFAVPCDRVLSTISGCSARLQQDGKNTQAGEDRLQDISSYLATVPWPDTVSLKSLPQKVAVHEPCSLQYPMRQADSVYRLLQRIPDIELLPLETKPVCCGGAGVYPLLQPDTAETLARHKQKQIGDSSADIIVTSNLGCALQLRAAATLGRLSIEVIHPVELIARQLNGKAFHPVAD